MWQHRLRPCAVLTETSEEFAPHYLAEIRHDLSQTTNSSILWLVVVLCINLSYSPTTKMPILPIALRIYVDNQPYFHYMT